MLFRYIDSRAENGLTALHLAAVSGNLECVRLLLDAGASMMVRTVDLDVMSEVTAPAGSTPLHVAAMTGNVSILQAMLQVTGCIGEADVTVVLLLLHAFPTLDTCSTCLHVKPHTLRLSPYLDVCHMCCLVCTVSCCFSDPALPCPALPCPVLPCVVLPCLVLPWPATTGLITLHIALCSLNYRNQSYKGSRVKA